MASHVESGSVLAARRAVEALRNGVPNREAVDELGCNQPQAEAGFVKMLEAMTEGHEPSAMPRGMLVSGPFGAGKSHLLAHLEYLALSRNFVCSKVSISKETPLYDLGKVFASAIENARMPEPDKRGRLVEEIAQTIDPSSDRYASFLQWAERTASAGLLSPIFPASLLVYGKAVDFDLNGNIESFWAGEKIQVSKIKTGLRKIGEAKTYQFRAPKVAELPPQRLRFAVELIKCVGYRGWVVLLDEIELVGSYSILQRGRSYAEVARWMGGARGEAYPGLIAVGTLVDSFPPVIISPDGQKKDRDYIRPRLENSTRYVSLGPRAEIGMDLLERECVDLERPGEDDMRATVEALRNLYRQAYDWSPPAYAVTAGGPGDEGRMRYKVRAAINEWDLLRLRPDSRPNIETEEFTNIYKENLDLEREATDDRE